jgi:preprotein translocase subunit SecF
MGRTIPSFRIALAMEKEEWKPFHNALDKKIQTSLMRCLISLNSTFLLVLILYS